MSEPLWLTRQEAAELLGVDVRTVDRWANAGGIHRYKVRGTKQNVRFNKQELLEFVEMKEAS